MARQTLVRHREDIKKKGVLTSQSFRPNVPIFPEETALTITYSVCHYLHPVGSTVPDLGGAVFGFFKDAVACATAADSFDDVNFAIKSNTEVFSEYGIIDDAAVILFKKFGEGRNNLEGDITIETVTDVVNPNFLPLFVDFNTDTAKQIFQGSVKNHFMIFKSASAKKFRTQLSQCKKCSQGFQK